MKVELQFLFSAYHLMMLYSFTKFHENIFDGFEVKQLTRFSYNKFQRRKILQNCRRSYLLVLCILSECCFFLFVTSFCEKGIRVIEDPASYKSIDPAK